MLAPPLLDAPADLARRSFGDVRLDRRVQTVSAALQAHPSCSFPKTFEDDAALEGFYRLLANKRVSYRPLLDAHFEASRERCVAAESVLALHDSSLFQFGGDPREGAFRTAKDKSGFLGHVCLAVTADGSRLPLGLLGMIPVVRFDDPEERAASSGTVYEVESERWIDLVAVVEDELDKSVHCVHVMDSEGDFYELLNYFVEHDCAFVVRLCHNRRIVSDDAPERLRTALRRAPVRLRRAVRLSPRKGETGQNASGRHAARDERVTTLEVSAVTASILQTRPDVGTREHLSLNIVHVTEANPPDGEEPVSWMLATSEPIETDEQIAAIVDAYRARWMIEEWFKALKTGCAYQERQIETLDGLLIVFGLLAPVATRLLALRWFGRNEPTRPATDVVAPEELELLRLLAAERRRALPLRPTVADVMIAVARLGGFITQNKVPGWQVLGRGWEQLQTMLRVYRLAKAKEVEM